MYRSLRSSAVAERVGVSAASGTARLLYHPDYNACNTFENPDVIVPKDHPVTVRVRGSRWTCPRCPSRQ